MQFSFVAFIFAIVFIRIKSDNATTYLCDRNSSCGCSLSPAVLTRIVGGESVSSHSWGWIVGLYHPNNNYFCAGTLISADLVVTGAHCLITDVTKLSQITLIAGSNSLSNSDNQGQIRGIYQVFIHPDYNDVLVVNDIAIIRVSTPFDLSDSNLAIICLPNAVTAADIAKSEYPVPGTNLVVIGWGVTQFGSNDLPAVLQQVTVQAVASTSPNCATSENELVNATVEFCAGVAAGGKDACQGDSGGPLMSFVSNQWQLVGITSSGYACALAGHSGVYTRVAYFIPFIQTIQNKTQTKYSAVTASPPNGYARLEMTMMGNIVLMTSVFICSILRAL